MLGISPRILFVLAAITMISCGASLAAHSSSARATQQAATGETIACRALEVHSSQNFVIVFFHQRDASDRDALGEFLRAHSDAVAQFQSAEGTWHDATVFRIKSCFGRGMLVFSAGAAKINEKDTFALRAAP
jgi:hypothetical protein